ncbi:MAG: hypothetical protein VX899_19645 [Myxococcota bacterium]|nr:hypothetical protein [Myxococcota bacterium]
MDVRERLLLESTRNRLKMAWVLIGMSGLLVVGGIVGLAGYELSFLSWKALMGAGLLGAAKGGYDLRKAQKTLDTLQESLSSSD